jgi:hypothetical protein
MAVIQNKVGIDAAKTSWLGRVAAIIFAAKYQNPITRILPGGRVNLCRKKEF